MSFVIFLTVSAIVGFIAGFKTSRARTGCAVLLIAPVGVIIFVNVYILIKPGQVGPTAAALDMYFGIIFSSAAAVVGFGLGKLLLRVMTRSKTLN